MSEKQNYQTYMQELSNKNYGEFNIWEELNKRIILAKLIKDSMPSLARGIVRIDLHDKQEIKSVIVNFKNVGHLKEYRMKEKEIIETMRALYKERELKSKGLVFHKLEAKVLRVNVEEKCEKEELINYIEGQENFINHVDKNKFPKLWKIFEEIRTKMFIQKEKYYEQKARGL